MWDYNCDINKLEMFEKEIDEFQYKKGFSLMN